jgi:hypothetical protein
MLDESLEKQPSATIILSQFPRKKMPFVRHETLSQSHGQYEYRSIGRTNPVSNTSWNSKDYPATRDLSEALSEAKHLPV